MKVYCRVEGGRVVEGPTTTVPDGSEEELKALNWFPREEIKIAYDGQTHYLAPQSVDIQAEKVVYTDVVVAFTEEELAQNALNNWHHAMHRHEEIMPSPLEDVITKIGTDGLAAETKKKYDDKRATRASKP